MEKPSFLKKFKLFFFFNGASQVCTESSRVDGPFHKKRVGKDALGERMVYTKA